MPWTHLCRLPGKLRIIFKRAKPGDTFFCVCGKLYELGMVGSRDTGKIRHTWTLVEDEEHGVESSTQQSETSVGFQANAN